MRVLITGNMGYVGPVLAGALRAEAPSSDVMGLDNGFFALCTLDDRLLPEREIDFQIYKDVRDVTEKDLAGVEAVVCLAALSNDPMGNYYGMQTIEINYGAVSKLAVISKMCKVKHFVFASSCSVYGFSENGVCDETSPVNPLTEYARSKVLSERFLEGLADESFRVTCFRFATACGASPRLRLDLVLNDFVASALTTGRIEILSDGTPWRPLIDVSDMAAAIIWAISDRRDDIPFLLLNAGVNHWNFQISALAAAVQEVLPDTEVFIDPDGQPDKRSYRVNFDKFASFTGDMFASRNINETIVRIRDLLLKYNFSDKDFRKSDYIRLNVLRKIEDMGLVTPGLRMRNGS